MNARGRLPFRFVQPYRPLFFLLSSFLFSSSLLNIIPTHCIIVWSVNRPKNKKKNKGVHIYVICCEVDIHRETVIHTVEHQHGHQQALWISSVQELNGVSNKQTNKKKNHIWKKAQQKRAFLAATNTITV